MKLLLALTLILLPQIGSADEKAIEVARTHFRSFLEKNYERLGVTYAPTVKLMPGHEFIKEEYGLAEAGARAKGADVERGKLIATMEKAPGEKFAKVYIEKLMSTFNFEALETAEGDFATEASDPVETPDGKLHSPTKEGDVLVKMSPPRGDFLLFHLRQESGKWKVVSEYFD